MSGELHDGSDVIQTIRLQEYKDLLPFAKSAEQERNLKALIETGSQRKAAQLLNINKSTLERSLARVRRYAAAKGHAPKAWGNINVPEGYQLGKVTVQGDSKGNIVQWWARQHPDHEARQEMMAAMIEAMSEKIVPADPVVPPPQNPSILLNNYVLTDIHLGMYAWMPESRDGDWDLEIAEKTVIGFFNQAIEQSPKADTAIFAQLGDFLHYDSYEQVTPTNRNLLDSDTRFPLLVDKAITVALKIINLLLQKYNHVHVKWCEGNHDMASSVMMRSWLKVYFRDEPRVTVDDDPGLFLCYVFGKVCLFYHHGHKKTPQTIDRVFVDLFKREYGSCDFTYAHVGDKHHKEKENNLMEVIQHSTLAARDAYAARHGYRSKRNARVTTYHREYGQVGDIFINPKMIENLS